MMGAPAGKGAAREEILLKLRERIVAFAASHIAGDTAEDLAQEVLLLLHQKYPHVDRLEELVPLAVQIARFKLMAWRRKAQRHGEYAQVDITGIQVADCADDPEALVERKLMLERLTRAVGKLGGRCRQLLRLKLQGRSFAEIQKEMGAQSINTVYTWDYRCRQQLLEAMGGGWETGKR
jgi:RNA polymerase sigma-70 factor, ECF subfamily